MIGENGVYVSVSLFEVCAEMNNWLGTSFAETAFGFVFLDVGIVEDIVKVWSVDF